jgi:hypothetical protein
LAKIQVNKLHVVLFSNVRHFRFSVSLQTGWFRPSWQIFLSHSDVTKKYLISVLVDETAIAVCIPDMATSKWISSDTRVFAIILGTGYRLDLRPDLKASLELRQYSVKLHYSLKWWTSMRETSPTKWRTQVKNYVHFSLYKYADVEINGDLFMLTSGICTTAILIIAVVRYFNNPPLCV